MADVFTGVGFFLWIQEWPLAADRLRRKARRVISAVSRVIFVIPGQRAVGACGVTDYSLDLATAAARAGSEVLLLPLHPAGAVEREWLEGLTEDVRIRLKMVDVPGICVLERLRHFPAAIAGFSPDWVNIQFYPKLFKTGRRYLPALVELARAVGNLPRVVTMHETWTKLGEFPGLRGWFRQRTRTRDLKKGLHLLNPRWMFVSTPSHQEELARAGFRVRLLPIGSNIRHHSLLPGVITPADVLSSMEQPVKMEMPPDPVVALLFARIIPTWDAEKMVKALRLEARKSGKTPFIISVGETGYGNAGWDRLTAAAADIQCLKLGRRPAREISWLLQVADWGLSPTPFAYWMKSSSCAAMASHGLPIVFTNFQLGMPMPSHAYLAGDEGFIPQPGVESLIRPVICADDLWQIVVRNVFTIPDPILNPALQEKA